MFRDTLQQFKALRPPVKALVFLYWIYIFTEAMLSVFTQIFIYQRFASVSLNIISTTLLYTGIMVGFVLVGYVASLFRLNIKHGFSSSFIVTVLSIVLLLLSQNKEAVSLAMFLGGIGQGLFWLTLHTFELTETKDEERDFYSSVLSAGTQILSLFGPAFATSLIWLSGTVLQWGTFTLLFVLTPLIYFLGFFCFSQLRDYRPSKVEWADLKHFFSDRKNQISQLYMMGTGFQHLLVRVILPLATFFILGTAFRVGIYNTLLALFASAFLLVIARYRKQGNRLQIYGITTLLLTLLTVWFGFEFTFFALVLYSIGGGILYPITRVSSHVIDLQTMESIGRPSRDFFATMLFRDLSLWIWRSLGGIIFLLFLTGTSTEREYLVTGLYFLAGSLLLTFIGAQVLVIRMEEMKNVRSSNVFK